MPKNETAVERLGRLQDELQQAMCNDEDLVEIKIAIEHAHSEVYAERAIADIQRRDRQEQ